MGKSQGKLTIIVCLLFNIVAAADKYFPEDFWFGAASSAFQAEGGWNEDGKGLSIWDHWIHYVEPTFAVENATADVSADTYHHGTDDIQYLTAMGLTHYRFSMSWPRILPNGTASYVNQKGIYYYNKLIDGLVSANIIPVATMYHFDLPYELQVKGGFLSNKFTEWFEDYARVLFENFGDRVKYWMTFNEPLILCRFSYDLGKFPPKLKLNGNGGYQCGHNLLLAHAKTYRLYEKEFKDKQNGFISVATNFKYSLPANETSEDDKEAARVTNIFKLDWFMDPLTKGDYPELMRTVVDRNSEEEGLSKSRLPVFTDEEKQLINGTVDYFVLITYSGDLCTLGGDFDSTSYERDINTTCTQPDSWKGSGNWRDTPWTLKGALLYIKEHYNNPPVLIAENGYPDNATLLDEDRVIFYRGYLTATLEAILDEGCNVFGYTAWSFLDVFETSFGYMQKFGFLYVDFKDPLRPRTRKYSSYIYENIARTKRIDYDYSPDFPLNNSNILYKISNNLLICLIIIYLPFSLF